MHNNRGLYHITPVSIHTSTVERFLISVPTMNWVRLRKKSFLPSIFSLLMRKWRHCQKLKCRVKLTMFFQDLFMSNVLWIIFYCKTWVNFVFFNNFIFFKQLTQHALFKVYKQLNFFPLNSSADFTNDNGNSLKGAFIHLLKIPNTRMVPFSILNNK